MDSEPGGHGNGYSNGNGNGTPAKLVLRAINENGVEVDQLTIQRTA